ncbi:hypothetical protein FSP39_013269 [Pinctada imbricata]|uniref:Phosphatidate cytidylyltransferase, mitochondrial n=1 Tax=Pinctada imbricata TaxID=66713 RepID=A0AA89C3G2_PINIB|nr:hypothetical protein FSP39_013269 [Pinctada imbricata]
MAAILNAFRFRADAVWKPAFSRFVSTDVCERILCNFPDGIDMAFAYGSAVFKQEGQDEAQKKSNMLDFIFVVNDPLEWHSQNLKANNSHYSFLKYLGPKAIADIQTKYGAGVYFNSKVFVDGREIKYGVLSTSELVSDLYDWKSLYISGRLHKPAKIIIRPEKSDILTAMQVNLQNALHASLLMLPEYFTEEQLYLKITSLSYDGDFRMRFGENKNKVSNIVSPNMPYFRQLYQHIWSKEPHLHWDSAQNCFEQYPNHVTQFHHLNLLPKLVQQNLLKHHQKNVKKSLDIEEVIRVMAFDPNCDERVADAIRDIVFKSSATQSIKSFFTAGVFKSLKYSARKIRKMREGNK